jgi:GAF domain-containing protein
MTGPQADAATAWLLSRLDQRCAEAAQELLVSMVEDLALATSEAVSLRVLSTDRKWLLPVVAYHPDPMLHERMTEVMTSTAQTADSGLWRRVLAERRPVRWHIAPGDVPADASAEQAEFLRRWPLRAVLGVPLIARDRGELIGGVSLVRFVRDEPFTDSDEALLVAFARRGELALGLREAAAALRGLDLTQQV